MREYELTERLHDECDRRGVRFTEGYTTRDGGRTDKESVTTIWRDEDRMHTLTFEESDGALFCVDSMTVEQCIAAVMQA